MKRFIAHCFGLLGFLLQGGAVIGLPVYVVFFDGSAWWLLAFLPLGFAGMIPLTIMNSMLKSAEGEQGEPIPSMLSRPAEVQDTVAEIDAFLEQHASICRDLIRGEAVTLANDASKTVYSLRTDGLKTDQLALILITNVLGRHLTSGEHHTYRGVLGAIGNDMLELWTSAVSAMQDRGYYSPEEAQEDMRWIQSEIKNVG